MNTNTPGKQGAEDDEAAEIPGKTKSRVAPEDPDERT